MTATSLPAPAVRPARARWGGRLRWLGRPYGLPLWVFTAGWVAWSVVDEGRVFLAAYAAGSDGPGYGARVAVQSRVFDIVLWTLFTPAILALCHRFPVGRGTWKKAVPLHLVAGCGLAALSAGLNWLHVRTFAPTSTFVNILSSIFHGNLLQYVMAAALAHVIFSYRHSRDRALRESHLEAQLARAQLHALKMQIEPHFLFNTLNSISQLVYENPAAADEMVASLGRLLRLTLEGASAEVVPLAREVQFLRAYLKIQGTRFQDRLGFDIRVAPEAEDALVPPLILQPLVENSVRHGLSSRSAAGHVRVSAEVRGGTLHLEVRDDGVGFPVTALRREGVGLTNTRARLERLYGPNQRLEIASAPDGGAVVAIEIPFRTASDA